MSESQRSIKDFGGTRHFRVWTGTLSWSWDDDKGMSHEFKIPNSYYIPEGKVRLLSPQHWAQTRKGTDKQGGAGEVTNGTTTTLFWNGSKNRRTVMLDRDGSNVATFPMSPGYSKFHAYCTELGIDESKEHDNDPLTGRRRASHDK